MGALQHQQYSLEIPAQGLQLPAHLESGDLKVSEWFHPKPVVLMTHAFFHTWAHVMMHMINSGSTTT